MLSKRGTASPVQDVLCSPQVSGGKGAELGLDARAQDLATWQGYGFPGWGLDQRGMPECAGRQNDVHLYQKCIK